MSITDLAQEATDSVAAGVPLPEILRRLEERVSALESQEIPEDLIESEYIGTDYTEVLERIADALESIDYRISRFGVPAKPVRPKVRVVNRDKVQPKEVHDYEVADGIPVPKDLPETHSEKEENDAVPEQ